MRKSPNEVWIMTTSTKSANENELQMRRVIKEISEGDITKSQFTVVMQGVLDENGALDFSAGLYGSPQEMIAACVLLMDRVMEHEPMAAVAFAACALGFMKNKSEDKEESQTSENVVDFKEALAKLKASKSTMH